MAGWDGSGVDPWLPQRLARDAAVAAAERKVYRHLWADLSAWIVKVRRAVSPAAELPPDPSAVWAFVPEWDQIVQRFVTGPVLDVMGIAFRRIFGDDYKWDSRPGVAAHLAEVRNRMVRTPDEVFNLIATSIAEAAGLGESIQKISERVRRVLSTTETDQWPNRAVTVARTETLGALNAGRQSAFDAAAEELGGEFEKMWLATDDTRTRKSHREADGQRVPLSSTFTIGADASLGLDGVQMARPGDPLGPASEVINCLTDPATPILTAGGSRPVADIRPGDLVVTHRGRLRPVLRLASPRLHSGPVVRIETAAGMLRVTPNHPVLTRQGWVVAGEVRAGMVVFRAAPVQRRDAVVGGGLRGVDAVVGLSPAAARLGREKQQDVSLRRLDDQERPQRCNDFNGLPGGHLPSAHPGPAFPGRSFVLVDDAQAGGVAQEMHKSGMAVGDHQARLVLEGAAGRVDTLSPPRAFADGDDAFPVNHGGEVSSSYGIHSIMVPLSVITSCWESAAGVRLYNFAVADDESYIAAGIAVHNCRCTLLLLRPGEEIDLSERGNAAWT